MKPQRIQLSRARGWRMPPNTIKVDRTTKFGNPFRVTSRRRAIECVYLFCMMVSGYICLTDGDVDAQRELVGVLKECKRNRWAPLRGKNLACWCRIGEPCHADILLQIVNKRRGQVLDMAEMLLRYGYRFENGRPVRVGKAFE
jgi:hypothetical protein